MVEELEKGLGGSVDSLRCQGRYHGTRLTFPSTISIDSLGPHSLASGISTMLI